jgi:methionyl-tRNA formyltransferase
MKTVVLTTETLHHAHFVKCLTDVFPVESVFVETAQLQPPFETHHSFEDLRDKYEAEECFNGRQPCLSEFAENKEFSSVNDPKAVSMLSDLMPDVVVVFGTCKLGAEVIATCPGGMINLHGGDPERYRGLDSHFWAIYHDDFSGLVTTLHRVNERLDDGDIVLQTSLEISHEMGLHMVRLVNTEACLKMTVSALDMYKRFGSFITRKQQRKGRYYSFMPKELKDICRDKFEKYSRGL